MGEKDSDGMADWRSMETCTTKHMLRPATVEDAMQCVLWAREGPNRRGLGAATWQDKVACPLTS